MTKGNPSTSDTPLPVDCVSYRLRRAARIAAKTYDHALRPSGLRTTQFTLLASLDRLGDTSIGDLSDALAVDGTTLNRNLEVLVRRGLVEDIAVADDYDGRVRKVRLSTLGETAYAAALPLWRAAQHRVVGALEPEHWAGMKDQLLRIEEACMGED
jgi:DNA-binding MarR family transcriptional regulator